MHKVHAFGLLARTHSSLIRAGIAVHAFNHRDIAGILAMIRTLGALVGTSFGQDATNSGNDRNDGFLLELLLR